MQAYHDLVNQVLVRGEKKTTRQGIDAHTIAGAFFEHDMSEGFPLLTTKKVPFRLIASELEFFIKGITDKQWLIDRNNHIWDEWANPQKAPYGHSPEAKKKCFMSGIWARYMDFSGDTTTRRTKIMPPITPDKAWINSNNWSRLSKPTPTIAA